MAILYNREDLFVEVEQDAGGFKVKTKCPACGYTVVIHLSSEDVEMARAVLADCTSGLHIKPFELEARYSPSETDCKDGVDVWGYLYPETVPMSED